MESPFSMQSGMAFLALRWRELAQLRPGPRSAQRRYYYTVYSLEKAGDLAEVHSFGSHDWYREEGEFLLRDQYEDGHWGRDDWKGVATSFALLFLRRATVRFQAIHRIVATGAGSGGSRDIDQVYVEKWGGSYAIGSILCAALEHDDPDLLRVADEAIERFLESEQGRLVPTLLLLAQQGPSGTRTFAVRALRRVTGVENGPLETFEAWFKQWSEVRGIERSRDQRGVPRLLEIARSSPWEKVRLQAIGALERVTALDAVGEIIGLLRDREAAVRERALACLRFLSGADLVFPARGSESARAAALERIENWFREDGVNLVRQRTVERAVAAFLAPNPPAFSREALAVLKASPGEAVNALLARLKGGLVD